MRKNILIIGFIGMLGICSGLSSCAPDYETEFNIMTLVVPDKSQASIVFSRNGDKSEIEVKTNVPFDNWQASSNAEWCKIVRQENKVLVSAGENNIYKQRQAEVTISYGHQSYSIRVFQFGNEPVILVGDEGDDEMVKDGYIKEVDAESKTATIAIATNLELDNIIVPDTCSWVHLPKQSGVLKKARAENEDVNKYKLTFTLDQNTDTVVRYCTVILQSSQNYNFTTSFLIKQHERGYIVEIEDAKKDYQMKASGGNITIPLKVNGPAKAYTYEIEKSAQSWITPQPSTRAMRDAYESFIIQPNIIEQVQVGHITFKSTDPNKPSEFTVTVTQDKFIPVPPINVEHVTATPQAGFIKLNWEIPENVDFTKIKVTYYDKVTKKDNEIEVNNATKSLIIEDTYECAGEYTFTIKTYGPTNIATLTPIVVTGRSEKSADSRVTLLASMLSANATQIDDGGGLPALVDDDIKTHYHTAWGFLSPGNQLHYVQINLTECPLQQLRFEYDSRNTPNSTGDVTNVGIWGSDTGSDSGWTLMGSENFTLQSTAGGHNIPTGNVTADKSYKYIRFTPEARRDQELDPKDTNKAWWNMSNLYLYRVNKHNEAWAKKELGIN